LFLFLNKKYNTPKILMDIESKINSNDSGRWK
jgi:hypothetical protein